VEVGEQRVVGPEHLHLARLRLLDAEDQLRLLEHRGGVRQDARALRLVLGIRDRAADAGAGLDEHLVAALGQLTHAGRRDRHAVLVGLDLSRNADLHSLSSLMHELPRA
jgi:hypothetical protein